MAGKPYKSKLIPYQQEIAKLRSGWPPTTYENIAAILNENHPGLNISPNAVWSFVKMRGGGAKKPKYQLPETSSTPEAASPTPPPPVTPATDVDAKKTTRSLTEPEPENYKNLFPK
jgi:hypothetical protein